jgi:hypothetical protein
VVQVFGLWRAGLAFDGQGMTAVPPRAISSRVDVNATRAVRNGIEDHKVFEEHYICERQGLAKIEPFAGKCDVASFTTA